MRFFFRVRFFPCALFSECAFFPCAYIHMRFFPVRFFPLCFFPVRFFPVTVQAYPFSLHITWQIGRSNNTEQHTSKKNNTLDHYPPLSPPPTPYPSSALWLQASAFNYSNCISYNFFIFCPICLKFSHKFLHTYSFILSIKMQNWKIRQFWVADPLKLRSNFCWIVI